MSKRTRILYAVIALLSLAGMYVSYSLIKLHYSNPDHLRTLRENYPFMKNYTLEPDDPYNQFLFEQKAPWCDINAFFSCVGVDESEYSELFGIGVAVYGFSGYVLLLLLALRAVFLRSARMCLTRIVLFLGALFGFIFTIWLNYIEFVVVHQLCIECTISATVILSIFVLSIIATDAEVD